MGSIKVLRFYEAIYEYGKGLVLGSRPIWPQVGCGFSHLQNGDHRIGIIRELSEIMHVKWFIE